MNTRNRQLELAALVGYGLPLGRSLVYGAAGVGYLNGRQLGEYRYTAHYSGLLGSETYFYSYRSYQALGLPAEVGILSPKNRAGGRWGLTFQANFNPEQTVYCALVSYWLGVSGKSNR
ncbi:hypothetical protein [Hymenobacter baengnokdamensis]|uniref:hypothetical protein n=1 Tax=Hymenobacter baengnokdamensis TaxID=2615203 RepID=UPI001784BC64|nr:hypothetical protein [Hymenobacter baengnokdamensis]